MIPFDVEITPVYPGLSAVFALGGCVGVVIPSKLFDGFVFFHPESFCVSFGKDETEAIENFYKDRDFEC